MAIQEEIKKAAEKGDFHKALRKHPQGAFAVPVEDKANEPVLWKGDIVVVHPGAEIEPGDFVYIEVQKRGKRMRGIRRYVEGDAGGLFLPFGRNYVHYSFNDNVAILGKVAELSRSLLGAPCLDDAHAYGIEHERAFFRRVVEMRHKETVAQLKREVEALKKEKAQLAEARRAKPAKRAKTQEAAVTALKPVRAKKPRKGKEAAPEKLAA